MNSKRWVIMLMCLLLVAGWALGQTGKRYVIVAKGQGAGSTAFQGAVAAAGGSIVRSLESIGVVIAASSNPGFAAAVLALPAVQGVAEDVEIQWLPRMPVVKAVAPPVVTGVNTEPFFGDQWNLRQIGADLAAAAGYLGQGAEVAVLDSGCYMDHLDLRANVDVGRAKSFVPGEVVQPTGGFNHGTHVAGIIAAAINNKGTQGVAPNATIVPVKVLREAGSGEFSWLIEGILYAADLRVDVINMSLGATFDRINAGGGGSGPLLAALSRAINHATASGVLVVSSAGNDALNLNSRLISIPAQSGDGMAVSATGPIGLDNFDRLASYSNYGQSVISVAAPGGDYTLYDDPGWEFDMVLSPGEVAGAAQVYYFAAGTSQAAPHVSGLAALLVGKYGKMRPAQLRALIEQSAADILKPGADPQTGHGRIDVAKALRLP